MMLRFLRNSATRRFFSTEKQALTEASKVLPGPIPADNPIYKEILEQQELQAKKDAAELAYGHNSVDNNFYGNLRDRSQGEASNRSFAYAITGTAQMAWGSVARLGVLKFLGSMSISADVVALSSIEVDLATVPEGQALTVKWRGKPVFIRHRTPAEIKQAQADDSQPLRHAQKDSERVQNEKYVIVIGVCTHLGCVPVNAAGDYGGWFCPCHGSHYDVSGRIRKGPAPLNLEVPQYRFLTESKIVLG